MFSVILSVISSERDPLAFAVTSRNGWMASGGKLMDLQGSNGKCPGVSAHIFSGPLGALPLMAGLPFPVGAVGCYR